MLVILLLGLLGFCLCQVPDSKYVLNFESPVYVVGEGSSEYIDTSRIICERYNESTAFMHGEVEFLKEMNDLIVELILQKESSGKHEILVSHDICDLCKELGDENSDYKGYLQYLGFPTSCPFDAGSFGIHNLLVDMDDLGIQDQHCGPYMAEIMMYKKTGDSCKNDRELLFTVKLDVSIEREG